MAGNGESCCSYLSPCFYFFVFATTIRVVWSAVAVSSLERFIVFALFFLSGRLGLQSRAIAAAVEDGVYKNIVAH